MDKQYFHEYYYLERSHWWFQARNEIIESILNDKIIQSQGNKLKILNTGVATGATTKLLEKYGEVTSLEYDDEFCDFLRNEMNIDPVNSSLTYLPFGDSEFDLVCAFDVIEHVDDDEEAIKEVRRILKDHGSFFLTVPAYQFLWSHHDVVNHHFRRYTLKGLSKLVVNGGLKIDYKTYFNFILFPPVFLARLIFKLFGQTEKKTDNQNSGSDFQVLNSNKLVTKLLYSMFKSENYFLLKNVRFPFGVSIMMIASK